jgi:solute:Na+ symporter, SSS family
MAPPISNPLTGKPTGSLVTSDQANWAYGTLVLGSSLAVFIYPHAFTGLISSSRRDVVRRNATILPIYSVMLGLLALLGYVALSDQTRVQAVKAAKNP